MVDGRVYSKAVFCTVFGAVLLLGTLRSWGGGPNTFTGQPTEATGTKTMRAETRKAWIVGGGGGLGWNKQTLKFTSSSSSGVNLLLGFDTVAGRGVTDKLVLSAAFGNRLGLSPVFFESVETYTFTVSVSYYPFEDNGAFLSVGGGSGIVHYEATSLFGSKREEDEAGYIILGAVGYEWRVDEMFALQLRFAMEDYQLDKPFDELRMFIIGLHLWLYI